MRGTPTPRMESVVSDKPYTFTPPKNSRFWPWFVSTWLHFYLKAAWGLEKVDFTGLDHIRASLEAGHGILLAPNHCRLSDPMALGSLVRALKQPYYIMGSAHAFRESRLQSWLLPRIGAFSINREGTDREALKTAVDILAKAERPLVVFPEGVITRTNDRLITLQDGVSFLARSAAKQRAAADPPGKVVIHPLALRYRFLGDVEKTLAAVLDRMEARLSWQAQHGTPLRERVVRIGHALLALKEIEYLGAARTGPAPERLAALMDSVLLPLEAQWLGPRAAAAAQDTVVMRVKNLRKALLPDLVSGGLNEEERAQRWKNLFDLEVAQQMFHFPPDYLGEHPTPERLIETVERYEEAFGQAPTIHRPMQLTIHAGPAIEVSPTRDKRAPSDPVMDQLAASLRSLLGIDAPAATAAVPGSFSA